MSSSKGNLKVKITLTCSCGNELTKEIRKQENDYSSIAEAFEGRDSFSFNQTWEESMTITCYCGEKIELGL